jgi:hypothetical protein
MKSAGFSVMQTSVKALTTAEANALLDCAASQGIRLVVSYFDTDETDVSYVSALRNKNAVLKTSRQWRAHLRLRV